MYRVGRKTQVTLHGDPEMRTALAAILMTGTAPFLLAAEATETKSVLDSVSLGSHVFGPRLGVDDLKGRVVLMEFWGRN